MRTHRGKQFDWSKPFKLVDSKTHFDELEPNENQFIISINAQPEPPTAPIQKKQQIIVPKIQTLRRITQVKNFASVQANYHRLPAKLNLPKLINYELNEVDHMFLQGHSHRFHHNSNPILTSEFLSKAFVEMEQKAGKDPVLPKNKGWMMSYMQKSYPELMEYENIHQFGELVYNYWKNRREELKFPLLRSLWRPNPEEFNNLLAFKPRQKEKRNLRRNNRLPEDEIAQQLEEEFSLAMKIAERIKAREQAKLKQVNFLFSSFHQDHKQYFDLPEFLPEFSMDIRNKDKQKHKRLSVEADQVRKSQLQIEKQNQVLQSITEVYDSKQSVVQFLSTVINEAERLTISHQKIFLQKNSTPRPNNPIFQPKEPNPQPVEQEPRKAQGMLPLKLFRQGNTIHRLFDEETEQEYRKYPKNYINYKMMKIRSYYFGDDDEGQYKDLKKNIAQSFKKFLSFNKNSNEA